VNLHRLFERYSAEVVRAEAGAREAVGGAMSSGTKRSRMPQRHSAVSTKCRFLTNPQFPDCQQWTRRTTIWRFILQ